MAQSERLASKGYYVEFAGVDISADYTTFDWNGESEAADLTSNNDAAVYEKPLVKKYGYTFEGFYRGTAGSAITAVLVEGTEGTIRWGPNGTAAGQPKGEALAYVKKYEHKSGGRSEGQTISVEWGPQGALISDPRSAVWP